QRNMADAVEEMRKHLNFVPREGDVYRVTFDSESREMAQKVLDTLIKGAIDEDRVRRSREAEEARKFLEAERRRADDDLKAKEAVLPQFINRPPKLASGVGAATPGALARADERERGPASSAVEVANLRMQKAQIEEQIIQAGSIPASASRGGADPAALEALG